MPFIGAGLSAGIGVGSWDELISMVVNKFFERKYYENLNIKEEVINLMASDKKIVDRCFLELGDLDEKEKVDSAQIQVCEKQRIEIIKGFWDELRKSGN